VGSATFHRRDTSDNSRVRCISEPEKQHQQQLLCAANSHQFPKFILAGFNLLSFHFEAHDTPFTQCTSFVSPSLFSTRLHSSKPASSGRFIALAVSDQVTPSSLENRADIHYSRPYQRWPERRSGARNCHAQSRKHCSGLGKAGLRAAGQVQKHFSRTVNQERPEAVDKPWQVRGSGRCYNGYVWTSTPLFKTNEIYSCQRSLTSSPSSRDRLDVAIRESRGTTSLETGRIWPRKTHITSIS